MNTRTRRTTETRVREILRHPFDHDGWTLQGFGMMRLYLDDEQVERLHIWDVGEAFPNVSTIHDHPWDFDSRIVAGQMLNQRYVIGDPGTGQFDLHSSKLRTGEGGHLIGEPFRVGCERRLVERYVGGDEYHQDAPEFHESIPEAGTVTVINRKFHTERDVAQVCWFAGGWGSAEPRPATEDEIEHFTHLARLRLR